MFLNPLMLAGLGGAMLPLVLHLLARSRFRTVDWAAMMFLQGADPRQRQSTRLKQIILLLLRMLLVSLLAVALARPLVSDAFAAIASGGHLSTVIVVDSSLSTGVVEAGKPRWELIRQAAIQVISAMQKGDEAALIVAGPAGHTPAWTTDLRSVADEITSLQPAGRANLAEAMAKASELLDRPEAANRRLFVISDRQALSWREVDPAFRAAWRTRTQHDEKSTPLVIIPVGGTSADNLAVQSVSVLNPPIVRDQPIDFEIKLRNYGPTRRQGVIVTLSPSTNNHEVGRASVDCPPDTTVPVRLTAKFWEVGPQYVTAAIVPPPGPPIGLAADDSMDYAVDITEATRVLILSGDERTPKLSAESYFATVALQPFAAAGRQGPDPCKVTVEPIAAAKPADVTAAQVVILANDATLSPTMATTIEQFIYDGGGVMVAPGNLSRASDYNDQFFRDGAGWLPAKLSPAESGEPTGLGQVDLPHPVMQFLRGRSELPPATVGKWFKLSPLRSDARTIASLANGDPLAVECAVGKGRVMLLSTAIDADWSTIPLTSFYLPFMQSSVRWLAGGGADRNLSAGQPITYAWTDAEPRTPTMILPDGRTLPLDPQRQGDRSEVRFAGTDLPGVYKLRLAPVHGGATVIPFVVTNPSDESDLTPMRAADWKSLARDLNATLIEPGSVTIADVLIGNRAGREIWGLLIIGVIGCALAETWLAGRWSRED